jgi:Na+/H+ antiporter NhaD/arsenite permease-like protein
VPTVASLIVLAAVLGLVAWGKVPDALAAVPAALLVVAVGLLSRSAGNSRQRLLLAISVAAVAVTTVMSLDATAVLFTPVVIGLVRSRKLESERPLLVTTQLANAGSGLLPVSNSPTCSCSRRPVSPSADSQ